MEAVLNDTLSSNAAAPLEIATYDGSGQVVHPDVIDAGVSGWNGKRYWLVATPYPSSDNDYENPSVWCSDNKTTWTVPVGGTNPVVAAPEAPAYNSDPDMILVGGTMYMIYRVRSADDTTDYLYMISSTDGVNWSAPTEVLNSTTHVYQSPALVKVGAAYKLYYHKYPNGETASTYYVSSASAPAGPYTDETLLTVNRVAAWSHIDVIYDGSLYYALMHDDTQHLYFAMSEDGLVWHRKGHVILTPTEAGWDKYGFYRSTLVRTATGFDMWYTGKASGSDWRIGYTMIVLGS